MEQKIFFQPGDLVQLKQDIPNKPIMVVCRIERNILKTNDDRNSLKGVKARWFTKDGLLQEAVFSTKDLILIKNER